MCLLDIVACLPYWRNADKSRDATINMAITSDDHCAVDDSTDDPSISVDDCLSDPTMDDSISSDPTVDDSITVKWWKILSAYQPFLS